MVGLLFCCGAAWRVHLARWQDSCRHHMWHAVAWCLNRHPEFHFKPPNSSLYGMLSVLQRSYKQMPATFTCSQNFLFALCMELPP